MTIYEYMKSCYVVNRMAPMAPAAPAGITARPPYVKFLCVSVRLSWTRFYWTYIRIGSDKIDDRWLLTTNHAIRRRNVGETESQFLMLKLANKVLNCVLLDSVGYFFYKLAPSSKRIIETASPFLPCVACLLHCVAWFCIWTNYSRFDVSQSRTYL